MAADRPVPARWFASLGALVAAGSQSKEVAQALLGLLPEGTQTTCQLDGAIGQAGKPLPRGVVVTAEVEAFGRLRGELTATVPPPAREETVAVLALAARLVGLRLPESPDDQRHLMELVTVGEAAGWLVHALNNHLNSMVLQAACVQMQVQEPLRAQAEHIRREGARAAARLRPLQVVRPWPAREGEKVDLGQLLPLVLQGEPAFARVHADLGEEEMPVAASTAGMKRLLTLLFRVVLRCTDATETVRVQLARPGSVEMVLTLPGARFEEEGEGLEALPQELTAGIHQLEREAARWLIRQTDGQVETVQTAEGVTVTVRWEE
jgi:hypothetical protein